jgi:hypothetical protein
MSFFKFMLEYPFIVAEGVRLSVDLPHRLKLKVDRDREKRRAAQRREAAKLIGVELDEIEFPDYSHTETPQLPAKPTPKTRRIDLIQVYRDGWRRQGEHECTVSINLDRLLIDHQHISPFLLGNEYMGSGAIGVIVFSAPFLLLLSPVIGLTRLYLNLQEKRRGLSRYGWSLLKALRKQLSPDELALLRKALQNEWSHDQAMSRPVTLDEAKSLLADCDLAEETVGPKYAKRYEGTECRGFHWFNDEGDQVAQGSFYGQRDHYVRVLGSNFENNQADELVDIYRSRRVHVHGNETEE